MIRPAKHQSESVHIGSTGFDLTDFPTVSLYEPMGLTRGDVTNGIDGVRGQRAHLS